MKRDGLLNGMKPGNPRDRDGMLSFDKLNRGTVIVIPAWFDELQWISVSIFQSKYYDSTMIGTINNNNRLYWVVWCMMVSIILQRQGVSFRDGKLFRVFACFAPFFEFFFESEFPVDLSFETFPGDPLPFPSISRSWKRSKITGIRFEKMSCKGICNGDKNVKISKIRIVRLAWYYKRSRGHVTRSKNSFDKCR